MKNLVDPLKPHLHDLLTQITCGAHLPRAQVPGSVGTVNNMNDLFPDVSREEMFPYPRILFHQKHKCFLILCNYMDRQSFRGSTDKDQQHG